MESSELAALRAELADTAVPEKKLSVRKVIFSLMPEIIAKKEAGMTLDDLVAWFSAKGYQTTRSALCNYMGEHKKKALLGNAPVGRSVPGASEAPGTGSPHGNPFRHQGVDVGTGDARTGFLSIAPDL